MYISSGIDTVNGHSVNVKFTGDKNACAALMQPIGRNFVGRLLEDVGESGAPFLRRTLQLSGALLIGTWNNGTMNLDVTVPTREGEEEPPIEMLSMAEECWCCCCFSHGEVTAVWGVEGCVGSCANDIPYPICFNQTDMGVLDYTGIRYRVKVCQKDHWTEFNALASDMAHYHVGDKVLVMHRGNWEKNDSGEYTGRLDTGDCLMQTLGCSNAACFGNHAPGWPSEKSVADNYKKPEGTYVIVPIDVLNVTRGIAERDLDFTKIEMANSGIAESSHLWIGKIVSINRDAGTANVDAINYTRGVSNSLANVPFKYNCECGETLGHLAFIPWSEDTDPQTKTSWCVILQQGDAYSIIGFKDGLPRKCYTCNTKHGIWLKDSAIAGVGDTVLEIRGGKPPFTWEAYSSWREHYNPFSFKKEESEGRSNTISADIQLFSVGSTPNAEVWIYDSCGDRIKCYAPTCCDGVSATIRFTGSVWSASRSTWIDSYESSDKRSYLWSITGANFHDGSFVGTGEDLSTDNVDVLRPVCGQYSLYLKCWDGYGKNSLDTFDSPEYMPDAYIVTDTYQMYFGSHTMISSSDSIFYKWKIDGSGAFSADLTVKELTGYNWVNVYAPSSNTVSCSGNSTIQMICVAKDGKETVVDSIRMAFTSDTTYLAYWKYHHDVCGGNAIDATCDCSTAVNSFTTGTVYYYGYDCANRLMTTYYTGTGTKCPAGCTNVIACSTTGGGCSNPKETFCTTTYLQICVNMLASCYTNPWDKRASLSEAQKAKCCPAGLGL